MPTRTDDSISSRTLFAYLKRQVKPSPNHHRTSLDATRGSSYSPRHDRWRFTCEPNEYCTTYRELRTHQWLEVVARSLSEINLLCLSHHPDEQRHVWSV